MSEILAYSELVKKVVKLKQQGPIIPAFTSIFRFPYTNDYIDWVENRLKTLPSFGRRWLNFYWEIIEKQIKPTGNIIPSHWNIGSPTNCVYIIANVNKQVIYIGKSEYPAIVRLLDRMIPKKSEKYPNGQIENNVPQIWDDILSKGKHLYCFYCYDLSFDPEILEHYLLYEYKDKNGSLPMYNKRMPNKKFLPGTLETRNSIGKIG